MDSAALAPGPLERHVLEEAARWYVRLHAAPADDASASDTQLWQRWLDEAPAHRRAWERVRALQARMGCVPSDIAVPILKRRRRGQVGRRGALKTLSLVLSVGTAGTLGWKALEQVPWQAWGATCRTGTGERRTYRLADGSVLELNTNSALDVSFDGQWRLVRLYQGEVLITTQPDRAEIARPFVVQTGEGRLTALGTRFIVRQLEGATRLTVLEHAVRAEPAEVPGHAARVGAGEQMLLKADGTGPAQAAPACEGAWTRGMLVALDWRLDEFLQELARYRPGLLHCDASVAALKVSGVFHLARPEAVLDNLMGTLPVRVQRLGRWWTRVTAA